MRHEISYEEVLNGSPAASAARGARLLKASREPPSDDPCTIDDMKAWPLLHSKAMHGIAGEIAAIATEHSEADPVAVLATVLTYAAAEFGRNQFIRIADETHHSRHFIAIVGSSSRARKGTSFRPVERIFKKAEEILRNRSLPECAGANLQVSRGPLSSGEGLIHAVRDPSEDETDAGVVDKRLLVIEAELGAALRAFQRKGNNLSMILRTLFDGDTVEPLTKSNRIRASEPHVCVVGHITRHELGDLLQGTEARNGLGNRFLWLCARRPKLVPRPKPMPEPKVEELASKLANFIVLAHNCEGNELMFSNLAMDHWVNVYPELTADHPGLLGALTSRSEAHAQRLALTYAQLDGVRQIELHHLEAALTLCRYASDSAAYLFDGSELDPAALKILEALASGPKTQTDISGLFDRHLPRGRLKALLTDLMDQGRIKLTKEKTGGAPRNVWTLMT